MTEAQSNRRNLWTVVNITHNCITFGTNPRPKIYYNDDIKHLKMGAVNHQITVLIMEITRLLFRIYRALLNISCDFTALNMKWGLSKKEQKN